MKKILSVFLLISCLFCNAQINPKVGDKFIYNVVVGEQHYDFIIVIKSIVPDFTFAWEMTNANKSAGKLTIPAAALANSNKMYNYFSGGDVTLKDMTSVLLSRATFKTLVSAKAAEIFDGNKKLSFTNDGKDGMGYKQNGEDVSVNAIYMSTGDNYRMTILDNPKFPLILSMEIGWSIHLSEYIPASK